MADQLQQLLDLEAIKRLKSRYYRFNDTQQWDEFRALFVDDAIYDSGTHVLTSADAIVATFGQGLAGGRTAHMAGLPDIELTGADSATGIWAFRDYVQLAGEGAPVGFVGYGHEHDDYVRTPDGWKFRRVVITRLRIDPLAGGLPQVMAGGS